jgi:hypothetical protein
MGSFLQNVGISIINYIYNFPLIDSSLVLYYPLDSSLNTTVANYASGLPVYDASLSIGTSISTSTNDFVTGLGDLSLNNTMGSVATKYVKSYNSFNLVPSAGLSISLWFSCSGELDTSGTLISLYQNSSYPSIELDIIGSTLFSQYIIPILPVTFSVLGGGSKSATNSPNNNVNYVFTTDGSFTVIVPNGNPGCSIKVLLVGGGGSGGGGQAAGVNNLSGLNGGGGGAGQVLETSIINITSTTTFRIVIGSGGFLNTSGGQTSFGISYIALGGGYGGSHNTTNISQANAIVAINGGGGSYSGYFIYSSANSTGPNNYSGGAGGTNNDNSYGGGGAGAGGNGTNGATIISNYGNAVDNGGNGITPSNYFLNNVYGIGGPTRKGGSDSTTSQPRSYSGQTLWRISNYTLPASQSQLSAPDNTGHGGIGGTWWYKVYTSYAITGGAGGSGICIVSIIS